VKRGGFREGEAVGYGERVCVVCAGTCAEVGDVCEWGAVMLGENYGWVFCGGGGLLSRLFTLDRRCPSYLSSCKI